MGNVIYSKECDEAAAKLGGYERIDCSLFPILEAISQNPEGFEKIEVGEYCVRIALTVPIGDVPALVWIFTIGQNGDVIFENVEEAERY